jgi:hypothetical protein
MIETDLCSYDRLMFQYRPNQPVSPMTAVFRVRSAAPHNTVVRYALVAAGPQAPDDRLFMAGGLNQWDGLLLS